MSTCIRKEIEIDMSDLIGDLGEEEMKSLGIVKLPPEEVAHHHTALFQAVESGDVQSIIRAAENIAWGMYGKILVPKGVM